MLEFAYWLLAFVAVIVGSCGLMLAVWSHVVRSDCASGKAAERMNEIDSYNNGALWKWM